MDNAIFRPQFLKQLIAYDLLRRECLLLTQSGHRWSRQRKGTVAITVRRPARFDFDDSRFVGAPSKLAFNAS
jgi:hypothetical protein